MKLLVALIDGSGRLRTEFHGLASPTVEATKAVRAVNGNKNARR